MADHVINASGSLNLEKCYKRRKYRRPTKNKYREIEDAAKPVEVLDINMDRTTHYNSTSLPPEVAEWQKQDQIAYWKSRAISLELENRMLYEHLRNVYAKTIEDYSQYNNSSQNNNSSGECQDQIVMELEAERKVTTNCKKKNDLKIQKPVSPKEPEGKNRIEDMKKIYGDMAPKIMGMETALQLNYERLVDDSKPPYWPSIPLHLTFK